MTDATAFGLEPGHLGRNRLGEISLHARVRDALARVCRAVPDSIFDVLDGHGDRMKLPAPPGDFVAPVEAFDIHPGAPHQIVAYGADAAARFGQACPDMACRPYAGPGEAIVFELGQEHLGRDSFGLPCLTDEVTRAIDAVFGAAPGSRCKVFDGEGLAFKPARGSARPRGISDRIASFDGDHASALNGFEPQYVAIFDRAAAERFARQFPAMPRRDLAEHERIRRRARSG